MTAKLDKRFRSEQIAAPPALPSRPPLARGAWTVELPMRPLQEPIYEFACHEANYGLANILKGARFVERQLDEK